MNSHEDFVKESLVIYKNSKKTQNKEQLDAISEVILLGFEKEVKKILYRWLEIFGEEPESKVYKKLCALDDKGFILSLLDEK